jgi:glycosyltransferase involved in cell wall biosynthesis
MVRPSPPISAIISRFGARFFKDPWGTDVKVRASVIVPAHNAESTLPACLRALGGGNGLPFETIVVDDRSTDRTAAIAAGFGAQVIESEGPGPAAARNTGVRRAQGDILVFVDADVAVQSDTVARIVESFDAAPDVAAVFGSYDDAPAEPNFFSQFKNLMHHFVHQNSPSEAMTFWAGCGAIRKTVFEAAGGFAAQRFPHPSVEDIELGMRLRRNGHKVRLDPTVQVKHLKRWTLGGLVHADVFRRAVPWSRLILEVGAVPDQLNLKRESRLSAMLVLGALASIALLTVQPAQTATAWSWWGAPVAFLLVAMGLNKTFYLFLKEKRGGTFAAQAVLWHQIYFAYSSLTFIYCWLGHRMMRLRLERS